MRKRWKWSCEGWDGPSTKSHVKLTQMSKIGQLCVECQIPLGMWHRKINHMHDQHRDQASVTGLSNSGSQ